MAKTAEKYLLYQMTITIKHLVYTKKILTDQAKTMTANNARITPNSGQYQKISGKGTTVGDYKAKLKPIRYCWTYV